jgi:hypothetical protein
VPDAVVIVLLELLLLLLPMLPLMPLAGLLMDVGEHEGEERIEEIVDEQEELDDVFSI